MDSFFRSTRNKLGPLCLRRPREVNFRDNAKISKVDFVSTHPSREQRKIYQFHVRFLLEALLRKTLLLVYELVQPVLFLETVFSK